MNNTVDENMFVLDLSKSQSASDIIFDLSSFLDKDESLNKRICLKLGEVELNQSQILSIKFLISGRDSSLVSIETQNETTKMAALSLGLIISKTEETHEPQEQLLEKEYKSVEEVREQQVEAQEQTPVVEQQEVEAKELPDMQNELDVIFNTTAQTSNIAESFQVEKVYSGNDGSIDFHYDDEYTKEDVEIDNFETKYIKQTIRSGQLINVEGNLVIIGDCHPGCEINASGDITVWGVLSGIAHAGNKGNSKARVRALKLNPIQIRIADLYSRRPDSINSFITEKSNEFVPEEARIINNEIVVFKIND